MKKLLSLTIMGLMLSVGASGAWANGGPYPTPVTDGQFGPAGQVTPNSNTPGNPGAFEVYNAINQLLGTSYTSNAQVDSLEYQGGTGTWVQGSNSGDVAIGIGATNSNTFEEYNAATPGTLVNPFGGSLSGNGATGDGTSANPYPGVPGVFSAGTNFGLALNTVGTDTINSSNDGANNTFYSNVGLNTDGFDHIMVYDLSQLNGQTVYVINPNTGVESQVTLVNPYLVTFEDLPLAANGGNSDMDYNDFDVLISGAAPVPEPMTWALLCVGLIGMAAFTLRRNNFKLGF